MAEPVGNFTVIESVYGKFVVNRHCAYQAETLIKTGRTHIEQELTKILSIVGSLPENSVFVDAGANIGLVSIPVAGALLSRGGIVHAFEAQRMLCYALGGAAALNDLTNLHIHHSALAAEPGVVRIAPPDYGKPQDFGLFSLADAAEGSQLETVVVARIDDLPLPRLDFLKIDVEGMELDVLHGARRMLGAFEPWCWVEFWKVGVEPIKSAFAGLPYRFFPMDNLNLLCAPTTRMQQSGIQVEGIEIS
jgi:FkbM family methyltransferase